MEVSVDDVPRTSAPARAWGWSETVVALVVLVVLGGGAAAWRWGTPALTDRLAERAAGTSQPARTSGASWTSVTGDVRARFPAPVRVGFVVDPEHSGRFSGTVARAETDGGAVAVARVEIADAAVEVPTSWDATIAAALVRVVAGNLPESLDDLGSTQVGRWPARELRGTVLGADGRRLDAAATVVTVRDSLLVVVVGLGAERGRAAVLENLEIAG